MQISSIKHLKTKDVFILSFYASIGFSLIATLFAMAFTIFGVPITVNEVEYYGAEGLLYSLLFIPIGIVGGTIALGFNMAIGWKLSRILLPTLGFWPKNDT